MRSFRGGGLIIWSLQSRAWWSENNVSTRASLSTLSVCRDMMKSRVWPLEWVGSDICCSRPNVSRISANCTRSWFWWSSQWILKSPIMTRRPLEDAKDSSRWVKSVMNALGEILFLDDGGTLYIITSLIASDAVVIIRWSISNAEDSKDAIIL